jgi:hypothetical protein
VKSRTSPDFKECFESLPAEIQQKVREVYKIFERDPTHPSLKFKKVKGTDDVWSVRKTRDYRALGVKEGDTRQFVGSLAEYDKLT